MWRMKEAIVTALDVTKDAALGLPVLTMIGGRELYVENFKSIVTYDAGMVKLLTKKGMITIHGQALEILFYDEDEIAIKGKITGVVLGGDS